ncbi:MAG: DUF853 family protein [Weeksellaceae bacterium]|nr:DUF853 family protein [Weeksellaceae bacterium]
MSKKEDFIQHIQNGYQPKGDYMTLGAGKLGEEIISEAQVKIPLKTLNRHGLIAGATGTGKTKTLQLICEQLSDHAVPVLVMDVKGDLSGIAQPGDAESRHIQERHKNVGIPYEAKGFPVEFLSLSNEPGVRLRATVTEFGPILLSRILELNETQTGVISVLFKFSDDHGLPLVDLNDLKKLMNYVRDNEEGKAELSRNYGSISPATLGAIHRKIVALEQQGADVFFGEPSFDVMDLLRTRDGKAMVNILRITDIQDRPHLFSTFMLTLLSEIYSVFPEMGDPEKPKLCIFIDEAHLVFQQASRALLQQIEIVVKLIRSKGVGVYFITQIPGDVPDNVLSQLGLKVQHAMRGFTAKDRREITKAVENYPISEFYNAGVTIQELGIGEAFITALDEKGVPTPLVHTHLRAPASRMDILTPTEIQNIIQSSDLVRHYERTLDSRTAYEILTEKMDQVTQQEEEAKSQAPTSAPPRRGRPAKEESFAEKVFGSPLVRDMGRTLTREITRTFFGSLGVRNTRRR